MFRNPKLFDWHLRSLRLYTNIYSRAASFSQILAEGEVQVSDKERAQQFENLFRDVVNVLVEKTINPETSRPYPPGMIEKSLHDLHSAVDTTRPAKVQALEMLPKLQTRMPIKRADMRLRIQVCRSDRVLEVHPKLRYIVSSVGTFGAVGT